MEHIDFFKQLVETAKRFRLETEEADVDIILTDGTVVQNRGEATELLSLYDEVIASAERSVAYLSNR